MYILEGKGKEKGKRKRCVSVGCCCCQTGTGRGGGKGVESQREGGGAIAVGYGIEREEGQEEDVVTCHLVSQCHPQEGTHNSSANRNVIPFLDAKGKKKLFIH